MKITQVAGFLGSGKTTFILELSRILAGDNERKVALVVNEIGEIPVDGQIIEESGMRMKDIGGGCICCEVAASFAKTLAALYRDFGPDHILVEPTGVAVPHQVKQAAQMGNRDAKISLGPAVILFDATRPAELLDMDMLGRLVVTQVTDADIIAISKIDAVEEQAVEDAIAKVKEFNEKAEIVKLSTFENIGIDEICQRILEWKEQ
jgi:G3E family GTPase